MTSGSAAEKKVAQGQPLAGTRPGEALAKQAREDMSRALRAAAEASAQAVAPVIQLPSEQERADMRRRVMEGMRRQKIEEILAHALKVPSFQGTNPEVVGQVVREVEAAIRANQRDIESMTLARLIKLKQPGLPYANVVATILRQVENYKRMGYLAFQ